MPRKPPPEGHLLRTLGDIVKTRRIERGLTQTDLANLIGRSVQAVEQYEQGMREPGIETLMRIAAAVDMALSSLVLPLDDVKLPPRESAYRDTSMRGVRAAARAQKRAQKGPNADPDP